MRFYRFKGGPAPPKAPLGRLRASSDTELLTGFVHGKEASEHEEIWAGAMDRAQRDYIFEYILDTPYQLPGEGNQIDFMDTTEIWQPIEIDGNWVHKSGAQKARDRARDAILNAELQKKGINEIIRIPGDDIPTAEDADRVLAEIT